MLGFALLFRRRPDRRAFLGGMLAAAVALVLIHGIWGGFWWGGFSFSQRFLAALFPVFLLGVAEIVRRFGRVGWAVLVVCTLFSMFVAFNLYVGYKGESEKDGIDTIVPPLHERRADADPARPAGGATRLGPLALTPR